MPNEQSPSSLELCHGEERSMNMTLSVMPNEQSQACLDFAMARGK